MESGHGATSNQDCAAVMNAWRVTRIAAKSREGPKIVAPRRRRPEGRECGESAAEMREQPEKEREDNAQDDAGRQGKIKGRVLTPINNVAREPAQAEWQASAEVKKHAQDDGENAGDDQGAAKFAQRLHLCIIDRMAGIVRTLTTTNISVLDQLETGKEIADLKSSGIGRVRAMRAVVADAGTEVVANGTGSGFLGVGRAHGIAPLLNGAFGFKDDGENLARRHKVREFTKERAFAVNGVESTRLRLCEAHGFDGYNLEASFVDARQDLALKISADCIRLDDCEGALDCHEKSFLFWAAKVRRQDTGNAKLITSAL